MEKIKKLFLLMAILIPAIAFTACGDDDKDEPNVPNQTLNVGQTYTIPADGTWVSDNDLIASIDGKTVKGVRVGEVAIRNGGQSFIVTVNPTIILFKDPYLQFGANQQAVKTFMSGFEFLGDEDGTLTYIDKSNSVGYGYSFENSKLKMSMVIAPSTIGSATRVGEYLAERYIPVTNQDDYIGMVSPDMSMLIIVMVKIQSGKAVYTIAYSQNTNGAKGRSINDLERVFEEMIAATPGELVKGGMK